MLMLSRLQQANLIIDSLKKKIERKERELVAKEDALNYYKDKLSKLKVTMDKI